MIDEGCLARLEEVKFEMLELLGEAEELVKGTSEEGSSGAYWLSHIKGALTNNSGVLGGSMITMEDAIKGIRTHDLETTEEEVDLVEIGEGFYYRRKRDLASSQIFNTEDEARGTFPEGIDWETDRGYPEENLGGK